MLHYRIATLLHFGPRASFTHHYIFSCCQFVGKNSWGDVAQQMLHNLVLVAHALYVRTFSGPGQEAFIVLIAFSSGFCMSLSVFAGLIIDRSKLNGVYQYAQSTLKGMGARSCSTVEYIMAAAADLQN